MTYISLEDERARIKEPPRFTVKRGSCQIEVFSLENDVYSLLAFVVCGEKVLARRYGNSTRALIAWVDTWLKPESEGQS